MRMAASISSIFQARFQDFSSSLAYRIVDRVVGFGQDKPSQLVSPAE